MCPILAFLSYRVGLRKLHVVGLIFYTIFYIININDFFSLLYPVVFVNNYFFRINISLSLSFVCIDLGTVFIERTVSALIFELPLFFLASVNRLIDVLIDFIEGYWISYVARTLSQFFPLSCLYISNCTCIVSKHIFESRRCF